MVIADYCSDSKLHFIISETFYNSEHREQRSVEVLSESFNSLNVASLQT